MERIELRTLSPDKAISRDTTKLHDKFAILKEEMVYNGKYRQILRKDIKFPNNKIHLFEVLSNNAFPSVSIFVWDTQK